MKNFNKYNVSSTLEYQLKQNKHAFIPFAVFNFLCEQYLSGKDVCKTSKNEVHFFLEIFNNYVLYCSVSN